LLLFFELLVVPFEIFVVVIAHLIDHGVYFGGFLNVLGELVVEVFSKETE